MAIVITKLNYLGPLSFSITVAVRHRFNSKGKPR
jgi:hypothetical protein